MTGGGVSGVVRAVVNGRPRVLAPGSTVADLVESLHPGGRGVAVAVGHEVVPRSAWASTPIASGDVVEVVTAAAGG